MWTIHTVCDDYRKLSGNSGQKYVCLGSGVIPRPAPGNTHIDFKVVDCPFHNRPDFIKGDPFVRIPLDSWKHAEIHVFIGIGGPAFLSSAARLFTVADPLPFYHVDLRTAPFIAVSPPFFMTMPKIFHI